jgi:hypothetical protein
LCIPISENKLRPGGPPVCEGNQLPQPTKITILRKNGEVIWVDAFFIVTALGGKKATIIGGVNITENKRLKEDLQATKDEEESNY